MMWLILGAYAGLCVVATIAYIAWGLVSRGKAGSTEVLDSMREFDRSVTDRRSERDTGAANDETGRHFRSLWNLRH
jgi:hypothetical protein